MKKAVKSSLSPVALLLLMQTGLAQSPAIGRHENPATYMTAGDNFAQNGQYTEAISNYSKYIKLDKSNPRAYQKRASVELQQQRYRDTIRDCSKALALNPQGSESLSVRARAFDATNEYKKEMKDVEALLAMQAANGVNLLWHAKLAERFGSANRVIDDCDRAIQLGLTRDQLAELYQLRARAYKKLGKKIEAEQELAKYQSLMP